MNSRSALSTMSDSTIKIVVVIIINVRLLSLLCYLYMCRAVAVLSREKLVVSYIALADVTRCRDVTNAE